MTVPQNSIIKRTKYMITDVKMCINDRYRDYSIAYWGRDR